MKLALTLVAALALTACTTTEMVGIAASECSQIGYAPGSAEHTACVERGFRTKDAQQDAAIQTAAWWAALELAY